MRKSIAQLIGASSTADLVDGGLDALAEEFGASLVVLYQQADEEISGVSPASMTSPMALYAAHYFERCPLQAVKRRYNPEVAIISDMIPRTLASRSEVLADFYRPQRLERHLTVRLSSEPYGASGCRGLVLSRSASDRPWRSKDVDEMKRLRPLLASAVEHAQQLDALRVAAKERDIFAALLSAVVRSPRLVFDGDARLVWASTNAIDVLQRARRRSSGLEEPLRSWVRAALSASRRGAAPCFVRTFDIGTEVIRLSLLIFRASPSGEPFVSVELGPFSEPEAVRAFGLSRAESRVLAVLLLGKSNRDIARHLCISVDTVSTHLKQIYAKMGVHSRLEAIVKAQDLERS